MGLFDFVKNAGAAMKNAEAANTTASNQQNEMLTNALKSKLDQYNLTVNDVEVQYDAGKVTITGEAADQQTREKVVLALGNVQGVAQVDDQMTVAAVEETAPEPQFYTVKSGDSLSKIAKEFYGNAMEYPKIFTANKPMLTDPNKIYPGQVLRIPPAE